MLDGMAESLAGEDGDKEAIKKLNPKNEEGKKFLDLVESVRKRKDFIDDKQTKNIGGISSNPTETINVKVDIDQLDNAKLVDVTEEIKPAEDGGQEEEGVETIKPIISEGGLELVTADKTDTPTLIQTDEKKENEEKKDEKKEDTDIVDDTKDDINQMQLMNNNITIVKKGS